MHQPIHGFGNKADYDASAFGSSEACCASLRGHDMKIRHIELEEIVVNADHQALGLPPVTHSYVIKPGFEG